ncbi:MAG: hypothetical protein M1274_10710 [Actinobacteria bacterium]|nr:hypothetical protein [Actinomycetota bacterium]
MSRIKRDAGILVLVAILLGLAVYFAFPLSKTNLGLDLQGGLSVILEAQETAKNPVTSSGIDQAVRIIQNRVNRLGVAEPEIQRQGQNKISVQLPGIDNPEQALAVIGKTAVLEFFDVKQFGTPYSSQADALQAAGVSSTDVLPEGKEIVHWTLANGNTADQWFLVTSPPVLTGSALTGASQGYDTNNQPKVDMTFNDAGAKTFEEVTGKMASTEQITGEVQRLAIVLDGEVESAPTVHEQISGGRAEITGKFTLDEARNLALVLRSGHLRNRQAC